MEHIDIKDFEEGMYISGYYLVESAESKTSKNGDNFLVLWLKDKTKKVQMNLWKTKPEDKNLYDSGCILYVEGSVEKYQEKFQIRMDKCRIADETDDVEIRDFVKSAPDTGINMYERVMNCINDQVKNEDLKKLTSAILTDYKEKMLDFPAATAFHHAEISGLLNHSLSMMIAAYQIAGCYKFLNRDLLICGCALHDIGKIEEYNLNKFGLCTSNKTVDGELVTHIIRGAMIVEEYGKKLGIDPEVTELMSHMILSHHGKAEFGSPVPPKIPEAEVLHIVDDMDAKLYEFREALENVKPGEFSEKVFAMDNIKVYKSKIN